MSKKMQIKQQKSKDNKPLLLKLHMSDKTYVTVPIRKHTKCADVINKVIKRQKYGYKHYKYAVVLFRYLNEG